MIFKFANHGTKEVIVLTASLVGILITMVTSRKKKAIADLLARYIPLK